MHEEIIETLKAELTKAGPVPEEWALRATKPSSAELAAFEPESLPY